MSPELKSIEYNEITQKFVALSDVYQQTDVDPSTVNSGAIIL
jgi:hypothetical protein